MAVLDTGIDPDHKDLKANLWRNDKEVPGNGLDDDNNGYVDDDRGVDLVDRHGSGADEQGHGTQVAGIIGAIGNNDRGVSGLCWKAKIISVKFMVAEGHGRQRRRRGDRVRGQRGRTDHQRELWHGRADRSRARGDRVRRRARHADRGFRRQRSRGFRRTPALPSNRPDENVISVAASTESSTLASFSNWGKTTVDLAAPGDSIASTADGGAYRLASGTSMAAPLVTAAAAMVRKQGDGLPFARIRKALLDNVTTRDRSRARWPAEADSTCAAR